MDSRKTGPVTCPYCQTHKIGEMDFLGGTVKLMGVKTIYFSESYALRISGDHIGIFKSEMLLASFPVDYCPKCGRELDHEEE